MGILDNLESYIDLGEMKEAWDDSDLELQIQDPQKVSEKAGDKE